MAAVRILFLGANARNTTRVQVGLEVSDIKEEIAKTGAGDLFQVELEVAVRPEQLQPEEPVPRTPPGRPRGRVAGAPAATAPGTASAGPRASVEAAAPAQAGDAGAVAKTRTKDIELGDRGKLKGGNVEGTGTTETETGNIKCGDDCELELGNVKNR